MKNKRKCYICGYTLCNHTENPKRTGEPIYPDNPVSYDREAAWMRAEAIYKQFFIDLSNFKIIEDSCKGFRTLVEERNMEELKPLARELVEISESNGPKQSRMLKVLNNINRVLGKQGWIK